MPHKALASPKCRVYVYGNRVLRLENGMVGMSASAADVPDTNGDLYYNCGQTDDVVYSEIGRKTYVTKNYQVKASVKVGGNTYTTGYLCNYAYIEEERHWWTNETAWYEWYAE